jgi:hypothetical protein
MLDRTTARNFLPPRRKERKEKISCFSELGVLCVFAGVTSFPILQADYSTENFKYV